MTKRSVFLGVLAVGLSAIGCGVDWSYVLPAAAGQIRLLSESIPISQAIAGGDLTEEQVAKLELIRDVRVYARDVLGLEVANNYTRFYDSHGEPVAFNISASRKDRFEPTTWTFPIVGTMPYLGYFDAAAANAEYEELSAQGLDVFMYEIDAYSGLEYFANPVLSPMLERNEIGLAETVIHELLHATVWRPSDTTFNESLATFYGRTGAVEYFASEFSDRPDLVQDAEERFEDADRYSDFALSLYQELDAFYSSDLASADKIVGREAVYQDGRDRFAAEVQPLMNQPERYEWVAVLPTNNAWMLGVRRYNLDLDVFEQVLEAAGRDWAEALQQFRSAAAAADPYSYLEQWLESGSEPKTSTAAPQGDVEHARSAALKTRGPCPARRTTTLISSQ